MGFSVGFSCIFVVKYCDFFLVPTKIKLQQKQKKMDANTSISQPFSNLQLEMLKLFADNVKEEDLQAIRELISKYFLEKAKDEADKIWEERKMNAHEELKIHRRKPYRKLQP